MTTLREKIDEYVREAISPHGKMLRTEIVDAILLAIKEELPKEHDHVKCLYCAWPESCVSYNDAIEEMERRLG